MARELILAWQDAKSLRWSAVGRLSYDKVQDKYTFRYTQAAKEANEKNVFSTLWGMDDLTKTYESVKEPLPVFQNRLLRKTRPEYEKYLEWLGVKGEELSPIKELELSGGVRATDNYQLFPVPENESGKYRLKFFVHGIRHMVGSYIERVETLKSGDHLKLMFDVQNHVDKNAIALRTEDPPELVGYLPSFFTNDIKKLIDQNGSEALCVNVMQVNLDAPSQFRLHCSLETPWPENFLPLNDALISPAT
jgi:hypothetical protein